MLVLTLALILSALTTSCLAAPANHAEKRQGDKTFTVTCIGPRCTSYPTTTAKTTTAPTTEKTTTTSKYTTPPHSPPTKTTKTTEQPTKTQSEETGPSSTRYPVPLYYQCGGFYNGEKWTGCTKCVSGATCVWQNDWYYQCVAGE